MINQITADHARDIPSSRHFMILVTCRTGNTVRHFESDSADEVEAFAVEEAKVFSRAASPIMIGEIIILDRGNQTISSINPFSKEFRNACNQIA